MRNALLVCVLLLTACTTSSKDDVLPNTPEPYFTGTSVSTNTPNIIVAETAVPTATPFTYVIQQGDTLSQLAEKFNISQDDLRTINPDINPNSMTIGMNILIPSGPLAASGASTPTPVPVPVTQTICHATADRGLWCFALIQNNTPDILEDVSAQITLTDQNGAVIASQRGLLPLDILPPNTSLPAYVFFSSVSADVNIQVQLLSALQVSNDNSRYLPVTLNNTLAQINADGHLAQLSGQIYLRAESQAATQVWVAAVAYDKNGQVVGVKRWEGGAIQSGTNISFNFAVASVGSRIDSVEFAVQAKP
jgi:LysM repeat protein